MFPISRLETMVGRRTTSKNVCCTKQNITVRSENFYEVIAVPLVMYNKNSIVISNLKNIIPARIFNELINTDFGIYNVRLLS